MTSPQETEPPTPNQHTEGTQRGVFMSLHAQKSWEVRIPNPQPQSKEGLSDTIWSCQLITQRGARSGSRSPSMAVIGDR